MYKVKAFFKIYIYGNNEAELFYSTLQEAVDKAHDSLYFDGFMFTASYDDSDVLHLVPKESIRRLEIIEVCSVCKEEFTSTKKVGVMINGERKCVCTNCAKELGNEV